MPPSGTKISKRAGMDRDRVGLAGHRHHLPTKFRDLRVYPRCPAAGVCRGGAHTRWVQALFDPDPHPVGVEVHAGGKDRPQIHPPGHR